MAIFSHLSAMGQHTILSKGYGMKDSSISNTILSALLLLNLLLLINSEFYKPLYLR
jgi:hypothetical protein